jgi:hypothetical protein
MKIHELILNSKNFYHFELTRLDNIRGVGKPFLESKVSEFKEQLDSKNIHDYTILLVVQLLFFQMSEYQSLIAINNDGNIVDELGVLIS